LLQNELNSFRQSLIKGMLSLFEEILDKRIEEKMDLGLDNIYFEVIQALQHRADK
jgi:c-di-GMP-related signal transduction protein